MKRNVTLSYILTLKYHWPDLKEAKKRKQGKVTLSGNKTFGAKTATVSHVELAHNRENRA